jgi:hypothetical protein
MSNTKKTTARQPKGRATTERLPVTDANARLLAGYAGCDVRTAKKFLEGGYIRTASVRERLEAAEQRARNEAKP